MELTEDEIFEKYVKRCGHWNRKTLLPYEYKWTCISCGYNVIKRKHELSKIPRKKFIFRKRLKYAEHKLFCICVDVHNLLEGDDSNKIYEVFSTLKIKKLKINEIWIEKHKDE